MELSTKSPPIEIHPSMLMQYGDCGLRTAVSYWAPEFLARGFRPKKRPKNIAGEFGTSMHKFVSHALGTILQTGSVVNVKESQEFALNYLQNTAKDFDPFQSWDDVTPKLNDAEIQLRVLSHLYYSVEGYKVMPQMVEQKLVAGLSFINPGYVLNFTVDHTTTTQTLVDLKTTKQKEPTDYTRQLGGYVEGLKAHGETMTSAIVVSLRRMNKDKPADMPRTQAYDTKLASDLAIVQIKRIVSDFEVFKKTGDPVLSFPTNPYSNLCGEKYCDAWNTDICPFWKTKKDL